MSVINFKLNPPLLEQKNTDKEQFEVSGVGFGKFQKMLDGYPAETIKDSIPDFHNTVDRFAKFENAINKNSFDRLQEVEAKKW